ncbi:hypothetical protein N8550_01745 [Pirellulaceae bacterium]|nr:hypothetical protein [Pirellulaceae bacterium]
MFRNHWDQSSGSDGEEYNECISSGIRNQNGICIDVVWAENEKIGSLDELFFVVPIPHCQDARNTRKINEI